MTDIEYTIQRMCARRGVALSKIESVAASWRVGFGIADGTALLASGASIFYYTTGFALDIITQFATGSPLFRFTNLGGGLAGNAEFPISTTYTVGQMFSFGYGSCWEFNSLTYHINGNTAGAAIMVGTVFKVTYI